MGINVKLTITRSLVQVKNFFLLEDLQGHVIYHVIYHVTEATLDHVLKSECSNFDRTDIIELNFR